MHPHLRKPASELASAGGAYVRRRFLFGGRDRDPGETLSAQEVASIPRANLSALVNTGRLELWPRAPGETPGQIGGECFLIHIGAGRYHVVRGVRLTSEPVSRDEAQALADGDSIVTH